MTLSATSTLHRTVLTALTLVVIAIVPTFARQPEREYFDTPLTTPADTLITLTAPTPTALHKAFEIRASAANPNSKRAERANAYGITFAISDTNSDFYSAVLSPSPYNVDNDIYSTTDAPTLTVTRHRYGHADSVIITRKIVDGIETNRLENTLAVEINCKTGLVEIYAGNHNASLIDALSVNPMQACGAMGIMSRGTPTFSLIVAEHTPDPAALTSTPYTYESVMQYLTDRNTTLLPIEGIWHYLDRENNPDYARPGGHYSFAVIANPETKALDIIYLSGAQTNASRWKEGMKKGELRPTQFDGVYDLEWYDASMEPVNDESAGRIEVGGEVLTLDFPLLKAKMRFARHRDK